MKLPEQAALPRRVADLRDELKQVNGDTLTDKQRDRILVKTSEAQLDLWDVVLDLHKTINKWVNGFSKAVIGVVIAVVIWFVTSIIPELLAHLSQK